MRDNDTEQAINTTRQVDKSHQSFPPVGRLLGKGGHKRGRLKVSGVMSSVGKIFR